MKNVQIDMCHAYKDCMCVCKQKWSKYDKYDQKYEAQKDGSAVSLNWAL
jgi:hypothetical protein